MVRRSAGEMDPAGGAAVHAGAPSAWPRNCPSAPPAGTCRSISTAAEMSASTRAVSTPAPAPAAGAAPEGNSTVDTCHGANTAPAPLATIGLLARGRPGDWSNRNPTKRTTASSATSSGAVGACAVTRARATAACRVRIDVTPAGTDSSSAPMSRSATASCGIVSAIYHQPHSPAGPRADCPFRLDRMRARSAATVAAS